MNFDLNFLTEFPVVVIGVVALLPVVLTLVLFRNRQRATARWNRPRIVTCLLGFGLGYLVLGTTWADRFAANAAARGACGDAAWGGPAAGGLVGAIVAIAVFEITRAVNASHSARLA